MSHDAPTRWPLISILWIAGLLAAMQFARVALTLGALSDRYPGAAVALSVSAVAVVGIALGVMAGSVVARIGARRAILWAVAGSGTLSLALAVPMPFGLFLTLRVFEGAGHLALVVALPTMMAAAAGPGMRSVVMAIWGTFFGVGFAIGAVAVPPLLGLGGLGAVHAAHGLAMLALWPALWVMLPRIIAGGAPLPRYAAAHRAIYTSPRRSAPGVGHGIYAGLFLASVTFLPVTLGLPWLAAALPLVNLSGTFAAGFLARVIAPGRIVTGGFAVAAILFAALWLAPGAILALLALTATGFVAGAGFAAVPDLNAAPQDQARANGAMAQLGNAGNFVGTPLFALVVAAGVAPAALAFAVCALGAVATAQVYGAARADG